MTPSQRRAIVVLLWVAAACFAATHLAWRALTIDGVDFPKHWVASRLLLAGESPYVGRDGGQLLGFNYPMFTALIYLPLAAFGEKTAEHVWDVCNLLFIAVGVWLLARGLRPEGEAPNDQPRREVSLLWGSLTVFLALSFRSMETSLRAANIDPLNFLLSCTCAVLLARRRDRAAGVMFALFALVKVAPVLLILPLMALRRWRVVGAMLATFAVYGVVLLLTGWWRWELFLVTDVLPALPHYWVGLSFSIHRFVAAVFMPAVLEEEHAYKLLIAVINLTVMAAWIGFLVWQGRRRAAPDVLFAAGLLSPIVFSPLLEINHLLWVVPAFWLQARAWVRGELTDRVFGVCWVAWVLAWLMEVYLWLPGMLGSSVDGWKLQTIALVLLATASLVAVASSREEPTPSPGRSTVPEPVS